MPLCRRGLVVPCNTITLVIRTSYSRGVPSVGCMHPNVVAELQLPSTKFSEVIHFVFCGCIDQALVPALLRGLFVVGYYRPVSGWV